ncbi:MAG: hypothetical protein QM736_14635 [Vicinamibacterales bacterium]
MFDRDYHVDMILWRHLVGAVTNAGYVKPTLSYELTKSNRVQGRQHHELRAQAGGDAGQRDDVRHRVQR